jgi:hypothetical protein
MQAPDSIARALKEIGFGFPGFEFDRRAHGNAAQERNR